MKDDVSMSYGMIGCHKELDGSRFTIQQRGEMLSIRHMDDHRFLVHLIIPREIAIAWDAHLLIIHGCAGKVMSAPKIQVSALRMFANMERLYIDSLEDNDFWLQIVPFIFDFPEDDEPPKERSHQTKRTRTPARSRRWSQRGDQRLMRS